MAGRQVQSAIRRCRKAVAAAGLTLDWLVTGADQVELPRASDDVHVDDELMGRVTDAIARLYKDERVALSPVDLGRLSAANIPRLPRPRPMARKGWP